MTTNTARLLLRIEEAAHEVVRQMELSPGGDSYIYIGPTSSVDELKEVIQQVFELRLSRARPAP